MALDENSCKLVNEIGLALGNLYTDSILSELPAGSWLVRPRFSNNVLSLAVAVNYEILSLHRLWEIQDPFFFLNQIGRGIALAITRYRQASLAADSIPSFLVQFSINDSSGTEYKLKCTSGVLLGALMEHTFDTPFGIMTILDNDED